MGQQELRAEYVEKTLRLLMPEGQTICLPCTRHTLQVRDGVSNDILNAIEARKEIVQSQGRCSVCLETTTVYEYAHRT